jgi:hypothetical protein
MKRALFNVAEFAWKATAGAASALQKFKSAKDLRYTPAAWNA